MSGSRASWRFPRRLRLGAAATACVAILFTVGPLALPAGAHASVVSVSPGAGEVLERSPNVVKVTFSEGIDVTRGGVTAYDGLGERVPVGELRQPAPDRLILPIRGTLDDGAYIVTWRGVSEDTHSLQGTWTFRVGDAPLGTGDIEALAGRLLADQKADAVVSVGWGIARGAVFASLALFLGGAVFVAVIWPRARSSRRARNVVMAGGIALLISTVAGILFFGAYSSGGTLGDAVSGDGLRDTLDTRFGHVWFARLVLACVGLLLARMLFSRRAVSEPRLPAWWYGAGAVVGVALVFTPGLAGHASAGDHQLLAQLVDAVHVGAMCVWLGGLTVLAVSVLPRRVLDEMRVAVPRFSRVAVGCVIALVITGLIQSWRLVGGLDALRDSEFGRILVVKLVVFALLLVVATLSREIVARLVTQSIPVVRGGAIDLDATSVAPPSGPSPRETRRELGALRRAVWAEVALGAGVLVVTALLVNAAPPGDSVNAAAGAQGVTLRNSSVVVDITASPGNAGVNDVYVTTYSPAGTPLAVTTVEVTIALPDRDIAPLALPLRALSPSRYFSPGFEIPLAGRWTVAVTVRLGPVDRVDLTGILEIREMERRP